MQRVIPTFNNKGVLADLVKESIIVIIPTYNEKDSLNLLVKSLKDVLKSYQNWEVLFIDDGSTDGSVELLTKIVMSESNFKLIQLHRNYGKSAALAEGFKLADGDYIITMDADLQDDPKEIPNLIAKLVNVGSSRWNNRIILSLMITPSLQPMVLRAGVMPNSAPI